MKATPASPPRPAAAAPDLKPSRTKPANPRWRARLGKVAFWAVVVGLIGLNLARLRDRWWPPLDLGAIHRLIERNEGEAAESALRDRLRAHEYDGEARLTLARLLLHRGANAAATRESRRVPAWWPSKAEALVLEGQAANAAGLAVEAEAAWRACLIDDPLHPTPPHFFSVAATALIGLLSLEDRQEEAITLLWPIFENSTEGDRPAILQTIMNLRLQGTNIPPDPTAMATLERYSASDPGDTAARRALARLALARHDWEAADSWFNQALAADPTNLDARLDRLLFWQDQRANAQNAAELAALASRATADSRYWISHGQQQERSGDFAGAAQSYRQAVKLRPFDETHLDNLARVLDRAGEADAAGSCRCQAQTIRAARQAIPAAYRALLDAQNQHRSAADLAPLRARLGDLCTVVGWTREAAVWNPRGSKDFASQP